MEQQKKKSKFVSSNIANSQHTMFVDNIIHKIDDDLNLKIPYKNFGK